MTPNKLNVVKNENQRLQNELDEIRRRYQALDSRNIASLSVFISLSLLAC
jgi:hypothetical protein